MLRQRQLSAPGPGGPGGLQLGGPGPGPSLYGSGSGAPSSGSSWPTNPIHIKQEIQIPQVRQAPVATEAGDSCLWLFSGFLTDQFTRQQPQSRHDVRQCEHTVRSPVQSSTAVCHSDPAATTTTATAATATTTTSPTPAAAATTTRPDKEYSVADQHQLQQQRWPRPPSECQQGRQ